MTDGRFSRVSISFVFASSGTVICSATLVLAAAIAAGCGSSGGGGASSNSTGSNTGSSATPTTPTSSVQASAASPQPPAPPAAGQSLSPPPPAPPAPPAPPPVAALSIASPLTLSGSSFAPGSTVTGTITYVNGGTGPLDIQNLAMTSRPPGGTHSGGPFDDLSPAIGVTTVQPGSTVTLTASRTITTSDPQGTWEVFTTYKDGSGWHDGPSTFATVGAASAPPIWITAYYGAWQTGKYPPSQIDFTAMTHICHFSLVPRADGTLDNAANGALIDAAASAAIITPAHAAGRKVLITVGGGGSHATFKAAVSSPVRTTLVQSIVTFVTRYGYDGVDIDFEPLDAPDAPDYVAFVRQLRTALGSGLLLTTAVPTASSSIVAQVASQLDQVNVMTYDMSGMWNGWVTWYNAPLLNGGLTFPTGAPCPASTVS